MLAAPAEVEIHSRSITSPLSDRLIVKLDQGAELCGISRRSMYRLIETNPDFRAAVVDLGMRGTYLSVEQLRVAIRRLPGT